MQYDHTVAIVTPVYRNTLTAEEEISRRHLMAFLGDYPKFLIIPDDLDISWPDFEVARFNRKFFKSKETYSYLLQSDLFYKSFDRFEYILIYQLDSLVFSDQLKFWCSQNYDYIGAPWLIDATGNQLGREGVGNGGFSLRRVSECRSVLADYKYKKRTWKGIIHPRSFVRGRPAFSHEDIFWSFHAREYRKQFRIPDVETALKFAFELDPKLCFARTGGKLPFGCHAWWRYDPEFWEEHLLSE